MCNYRNICDSVCFCVTVEAMVELCFCLHLCLCVLVQCVFVCMWNSMFSTQLCFFACVCESSCGACVWTLAHMGRVREGRRARRRWERGLMPNKLTISLLSPSLSIEQQTLSFRHLCGQPPPDPRGPHPFTLLNSMFREKLMIGKWLFFFLSSFFSIKPLKKCQPLILFSPTLFFPLTSFL